MDYIPLTSAQEKEMLEAIGVSSIDELLESIPAPVRLKKPLSVAGPLSELELARAVEALAAKNVTVEQVNSFLGAGCYDHFIPAAVRAIVSRAEYCTAYTPYQPEASQGTLQATYEYQTFICMLTDMDVTNASLYDGSTALAEAVLMAHRINRRPKVLIAETIHPEYRKVLVAYTKHLGIELVSIPYAKDGALDLETLNAVLDEQVCCVALQNPNFFGVLEKDIRAIVARAHEYGTLCISAVHPLSLGLIRTGKSVDVDIVVGDGQALGNGLAFGGPTFGFLATKKEFIRKIPGRIVGKTCDKNGAVGYVLTLQAREQHIRREKATSNICSNQALNALACAVYCALMGPEGIKDVASACVDKTYYCIERLKKIKGVTFPFKAASHFNEFVIELPRDPRRISALLLKKNIIPGFALGTYYPKLRNCLLIALTEKKTKHQIDEFVKTLGASLRQ